MLAPARSPGDYLERVRQSGRDWAYISALDDGSLKTLLSPEEHPVSRKPLPDFEALRLEMKKKGVTLQLLWEEYRAVHPDGYGRTQFCELYRRHGGTLGVTWDHKHQLEKVFSYEFETEGQLLGDFWEAVQAYLGEGHA